MRCLVSFRSLASAFVLCVPFFAVACSSGGSASGSVSVPESTKLTALSDADRGDLCDWASSQFGGYGKKKSCEGSDASMGFDSKQACTDDLKKYGASCEATVGDYEKFTKTFSECKEQNGSADAFGKMMSCALSGLGSAGSGMSNVSVGIPGH
jgi:hypothetical protein